MHRHLRSKSLKFIHDDDESCEFCYLILPSVLSGMALVMKLMHFLRLITLLGLLVREVDLSIRDSII